jgi:hypothetical protein
MVVATVVGDCYEGRSHARLGVLEANIDVLPTGNGGASNGQGC